MKENQKCTNGGYFYYKEREGRSRRGLRYQVFASKVFSTIYFTLDNQYKHIKSFITQNYSTIIIMFKSMKKVYVER